MLNRLQRKSNNTDNQEAENSAEVFGRELGLLSKIFGCAHRNLSRPFVEGNTSYKSCLTCGARKQFDPKTFESNGKFYYPPMRRI